jgi:hypothetical protein
MRRKTPLKRSPWRPKPRAPAKEARSKAKARKRAREKHERDFGPHADWVAARGCEVLGCNRPALRHHEPPRKMGGSKQPTAHRVTGLCLEHHDAQFPLSRHRLGLAKFNQTHGTDLLMAAARNWRESPFGGADR